MEASGWKIAHASAVGTSHIERDVPCQDFYSIKIADSAGGEILIVALADGAGSASEGLTGAEWACELFVQEIEQLFRLGGNLDHLNLEFGQQWITAFQNKIGNFAESQGKAIRDYASTLLIALLSEESAVFYQMGDGAIVFSPVERPDSYYFGVVPAESLYANTTDFLTDKQADENLQYNFLSQAVQNLVMFSDGIQSLAINYANGFPGEPFAPFLKPMLDPLKNGQLEEAEFNKKLMDFLNSKIVNDKTDDDKTIILVSRKEVET